MLSLFWLQTEAQVPLIRCVFSFETLGVRCSPKTQGALEPGTERLRLMITKPIRMPWWNLIDSARRTGTVQMSSEWWCHVTKHCTSENQQQLFMDFFPPGIFLWTLQNHRKTWGKPAAWSGFGRHSHGHWGPDCWFPEFSMPPLSAGSWIKNNWLI